MFRGIRVQFLSVAVLPLGLGFAVYGAPGATVEATLAPTTGIAGPVSYAQQIAPLFEANCVECHGAETKEAGLALHTYAAIMAGSEFGTVVEAGNPAGSILIDMIAAGEMPRDGEVLSPEQVALVRSWVQAGANDN